MPQKNNTDQFTAPPRPPRSRLRRVLRAHVLGSYAWVLCYAPGVLERMQKDSTLPMASKIAGGIIGFILAPAIAPAIILAAPVAALVQHRPLMLIYCVALAAYLLTAVATFWLGIRQRIEAT